MSIFYLVQEDGTTFTPDCCESFGYRDVGSLTEYTVESGAKVSDHYVLENKEINLSFVITDLNTTDSANRLSTGDFIQGINRLRESKRPFKFYWRAETSNMERFFANLMFTEVNFNQDTSFGYANGVYAYKGTFTMKQIQFTNRATISRQMVPALKGSSSANKASNASTKFTGFPKNSPLLVKPPPVPTSTADPNLQMLKSEISRNKRGGS